MKLAKRLVSFYESHLQPQIHWGAGEHVTGRVDGKGAIISGAVGGMGDSHRPRWSGHYRAAGGMLGFLSKMLSGSYSALMA
jgi:hypothetical protein